MAYTPPLLNAVNSDLAGPYTPPLLNAVDSELSSSSGVASKSQVGAGGAVSGGSGGITFTYNSYVIAERINKKFDAIYAAYNSVARIDDTHFAVTYQNSSGYGVVVTFVFDPATYDFIAIDSLTYDTNTSESTSMVLLDSSHLAIAYRYSATNGCVKVISFDGNYELSSTSTLTHDTSNGWANSLIKIDDTHLALAYSGTSSAGFLKTFSVDGSYNITELDAVEFDANYDNYNSLVLVDSTHLALAFSGNGSDGWLKTFVLDGSYNISEIDAYEYDTSLGVWNSLAKLDSTHLALANYDGTGHITTFELDGSYNISELSSLTISDIVDYVSMSLIDATHLALVYTDKFDDGWIGTYEINTSGYTISEISLTEHDGTTTSDNSSTMVDSESLVLAYTTADSSGVIKTFSVGEQVGIPSMTFSADGGGELGGAATISETYLQESSYDGSGGAVLGGDAAVDSVLYQLGSQEGDGGTVVWYDPILRDSTGEPILDSNGQYIETDITPHVGVKMPASGGFIVGGSSVVKAVEVFDPSAGVVIGGSADTATDISAYIIGSGGPVIGGSADASIMHAEIFEASGGCITGGAANLYSEATTSFGASGGLVVGGEATTSGTHTTAVDFTGGIVNGGSASIIAASEVTGNFGAFVFGGASISAGSVFPPIFYKYTGVGGCITGLVGADAVQAYMFRADGGAISGGTSTVILSAEQVADDGLVAGGSANVSAGIVQSPTDGAVTGGSSDTKTVVVISPADGAIVNGAANITFMAPGIATHISRGGVVIGGAADIDLTRPVTGKGVSFYSDPRATVFSNERKTTTYYSDYVDLELAA